MEIRIGSYRFEDEYRENKNNILLSKLGSLVIKKGRLRGFGHVEYKDDANWVKCCMTMEVDGTR